MSGDVLGNYLGNAWLQMLVDAGAFMALMTDDPTTVTDPSLEFDGGLYIRQAVSLSAPSGKAIVSTNNQAFVGLNPALITYLALFDLQAGGHFLLAKALATPIPVTVSGNFLCAPGDFAIQL